MKLIHIYNRLDTHCPPNLNDKYPLDIGLCNQLISLVNGILHAQDIVIVDSFLCCSLTGTICKLGDVIDLPVTSSKLRQLGRNVSIFDRLDPLPITKAEYGVRSKWVDVTPIVHHHQKYYADIDASKRSLNAVFRYDPCPDQKKSLRLTLASGQQVTYAEDVALLPFGHSLWHGQSYFLWYTHQSDLVAYHNVFSCLTFRSEFNRIVDELLAGNQVTYCIHFRYDLGALQHWSKANEMPVDEFSGKLLTKYVDLIRKYFPIGAVIYVLGNTSIDVFQSLSDYRFVGFSSEQKSSLTKQYLNLQGNELNAIIDFLIGSRCIQGFIGCHSLSKNRGSTFSYFLYHRLKHIPRCILFDLDAVDDVEECYQN